MPLTEKQKTGLQIAGLAIGAVGLIYTLTKHGGAVQVQGTPPVVLGGGANPGSAAGINPISDIPSPLATPQLVPISIPTIPAVGAVTNSASNAPSTCCGGLSSVQYTTSQPIGFAPVASDYLPPVDPASDVAYPSVTPQPDRFTQEFGQSSGALGGLISYTQSALQNLFNVNPVAAQIQSDSFFARASAGRFP